MSDKILVIGSNSISGASFIKHALQEGCQVIGVSRSIEPIDAFLPYKWINEDALSAFNFYQCDLNTDLDKVLEIIEYFSPRYIVNFASQSMVAESWDYPEHWYTTNVLSMVKFFESLRKLGGFEKYIHISTPEVYGNCQGLVKENTHYQPSTPYATSRAACDMHLMNLYTNYNFPVIFTRAANVYGPGQRLYRIIPKTILSIKLGEKLPLHGGGESIRAFIHTEDMAEGTLKSSHTGKPGDIFHFSTQQTVSIKELVETICAGLDANFEETVIATNERPGKDAAYILDSTKAREDLGWTDRVSLNDGIQDTIDWVDTHFNTLAQEPLTYIHKA